MQVFYTAGMRAFNKAIPEALFVDKALKSLGFKQTNQNFSNENSAGFISLIKDNPEEQQRYFESSVKAIQKSELVIIEASRMHIDLGFLVGLSLNYARPCLIMSTQVNPTYLLRGLKDQRLIIRMYNEFNCVEVIKEASDLVSQNRDRRFNFFISPRLLDYLEEVSNQDATTKSSYIRKLIADDMRKRRKETEESARLFFTDEEGSSYF